MNKDTSDLRNELNEKTKQLDSIRKEMTEVEQLKTEIETLRGDLEKEKKTAKDLHMQNVKLNSLVKIGQDSLKLEQDKVKELQSQLNLKNGSISKNGNNCEHSNLNTSVGETTDEV